MMLVLRKRWIPTKLIFERGYDFNFYRGWKGNSSLCTSSPAPPLPDHCIRPDGTLRKFHCSYIYFVVQEYFKDKKLMESNSNDIKNYKINFQMYGDKWKNLSDDDRMEIENAYSNYMKCHWTPYYEKTVDPKLILLAKIKKTEGSRIKLFRNIKNYYPPAPHHEFFKKNFFHNSNTEGNIGEFDNHLALIAQKRTESWTSLDKQTKEFYRDEAKEKNLNRCLSHEEEIEFLKMSVNIKNLKIEAMNQDEDDDDSDIEERIKRMELIRFRFLFKNYDIKTKFGLLNGYSLFLKEVHLSSTEASKDWLRLTTKEKEDYKSRANLNLNKKFMLMDLNKEQKNYLLTKRLIKYKS